LRLTSSFRRKSNDSPPQQQARDEDDVALTALRERQLVVEIDEEKLARLETWTPTPAAAPLSMDLSVFVVATSAADVDAGKFQVVGDPTLGASAAGRNLGRFADLLGAAWDVILIALMLGGAAISATGVYLAVRRVRNDVTMLFRALTSSRGIARRNPTLNPARPS
jgi:hypothetical protein